MIELILEAFAIEFSSDSRLGVVAGFGPEITVIDAALNQVVGTIDIGADDPPDPTVLDSFSSGIAITLIVDSYCASSSDAPAKPTGLKTRHRGFRRVLRRPVEIATQSGH